MSQENVEIVRRWIDTYNRRDIHGLLEISDKDVEFRSIFASIETGGVFRRRSGVFAYFETLDDAYERFSGSPTAHPRRRRSRSRDGRRALARQGERCRREDADPCGVLA